MSNRKILIIEEEARRVKKLEQILLSKGIEVFSAGDAARAIEIVKCEALDLVLLQMKIADTDGPSILWEIKQLTPMVRIVMMADNVLVEELVAAIKLGVDGVILRPFDVDVVVDAVLRDDVIDLFDGYLKAMWKRVVSVVGVSTGLMVFQLAVSNQADTGGPLDKLHVSENGIDLQMLKVENGAWDLDELRSELQVLLGSIFDFLGYLAGNIITELLINDLSDELQRQSVLSRKPG
jgi:two-component system, response regulator, stage 0 sporulation protein F